MDSIVPWQVIPGVGLVELVGYSSIIRLWKSGPSCAHKGGQAPTLAMGPARGLGRSLGGSHLGRLFANLPGIKDEFERIGILVFLHQLEIHEPLALATAGL